MRFRNTLALAVLFLALGGYLYFIENPRHEEATEQKKLVRFKPEDASEITLTYSDKQIVLKKTGAGWQMQKPIDVDADQVAVSNLVRAVADAEVKRTLEGGSQSLEVYGLDKPEAIVSIVLSNGAKLPSIRVGKTAPVGFSAYAQLEGTSDVKLVPSVFQTGLKRDVKDLRSKTIIDFQDADVQQVEITTPQSTIHLSRQGDGWALDKPLSAKADAAEVTSFLSSLRGARAEEFVDEPSAIGEYGLDAPRQKVAVLTGKELTRKELWIGAEQAKDSKNVLWVKRPDSNVVYGVGTWTWNGLNKQAMAFRDKTVLSFDMANVGSIEVARRDGETYRLVKESASSSERTPAPSSTPAAEPAGAVWKVDGEKSSNAAAIRDLVADLHGLKGYEIAAEKPADLVKYGLAQPELTFSVIDGGGKPIGRVLAGQVTDGSKTEAYAMAEGGDVVLHLRGYLYEHIDKKKLDLSTTSPTPSPTPPS
jgi:Domain of unknown function (DUF4340)